MNFDDDGLLIHQAWMTKQLYDNMNSDDDGLLIHQAWMTMQLNEDRLGEKATCDLVLKSGGSSFWVHKCIIMVALKFFKNMFTVEMKEKYSEGVEIQHIPHHRLGNLIDFVYTGQIELTEDNVIDVLDDAEYTQIEALKNQCELFLMKAIDANNCLRLRAYAQRYNLERGFCECNQWIAQHLAAVVELEDFMKLGVDDVLCIIKLRKKNCEEIAFNGIMGWVNHNPSQRQTQFASLFSLLDLSSMATGFRMKVFNETLVKQNQTCANVLEYLLKLTAVSQRGAGDQFLLIGGSDSMETSVKSCIVYDVITRQSEHLPDLDGNCCAPTSIKVGNNVYVMGGARDTYGSSAQKRCLVLDWTDKTKWTKVSDMLEARSFCGSAYLKDYIYVVGGFSFQKHLASGEKMDIGSGRWTKISDMSSEKDEQGTVVCNDLIYSIGGQDEFFNPLSVCESYDPRCEHWNKIASLDVATYGMACVEKNEMIYSIGGRSKDQRQVVRYDPRANKWENLSPLRIPRDRSCGCVVGNKIFVIGGKNDLDLASSSVECYDSRTDIWTTCFDLEAPSIAATVVAV